MQFVAFRAAFVKRADSGERKPLRKIAALLAATLVLAGCATRPVNPPSSQYDPNKAYRIERPSDNPEDNATLVILAFSGGGTRAAA